MARIDKKVALMIGATRDGNMSQAIAKNFLSEGTAVAVSNCGEYALNHFASEDNAIAHACDLPFKADVFRQVQGELKG